ncbi:ribonuclease domain-containing protein, partial [Testudinibacter aquarius]
KTAAQGVAYTAEDNLFDCLKNPLACVTGKWATFDSASGDLLRTHYNQADVNSLYGKDMTAETALVPLMRGGTVVAEVLPVVKAGSVAVKSVDNMLSPLAKGVSANESLPVVGKTTDYPLTEFNHQAHNAAIYEALKLDLKTQQAANHLIDSLKNTGKLPDNYVTKDIAEKVYSWQSGKPFKQGQLGGDIFDNNLNLLPSAPERIWYEADIGIDNNIGRNKQPGTRLLYSNDGYLYMTTDHYKTFKEIGKWK